MRFGYVVEYDGFIFRIRGKNGEGFIEVSRVVAEGVLSSIGRGLYEGCYEGYSYCVHGDMLVIGSGGSSLRIYVADFRGIVYCGIGCSYYGWVY